MQFSLPVFDLCPSSFPSITLMAPYGFSATFACWIRGANSSELLQRASTFWPKWYPPAVLSLFPLHSASSHPLSASLLLYLLMHISQKQQVQVGITQAFIPTQSYHRLTNYCNTQSDHRWFEELPGQFQLNKLKSSVLHFCTQQCPRAGFLLSRKHTWCFFVLFCFVIISRFPTLSGLISNHGD